MSAARSIEFRLAAVAASLFVLASLLLLPGTAAAAGIGISNPHPPGAVAAVWTAERLRQARPLAIPEADLASAPEAAVEELTAGAGPAAGGDGLPPIAPMAPDPANRLFEPASDAHASDRAGLVTHPAPDTGTAHAQYTSSRLVPLSADRSYPYLTVGKLFLHIPGGGDATCTAAVIRPRVLLTAGHCVHSGTASPGFYEDFLFVPAYRDGAAPFGTWDWQSVFVTATWASGHGTVPNAADYAMFELRDQPVGGVNRRAGDVLGFLGFQTLRLLPNHAHLLGYAANLDGAEKLHQVAAGSFRAVSPNNVEYGSDMREGSSGGPWIQNFGAPAVGQTGGTNNGSNRVIGVTSYLIQQAAVKTEGASIPDSRFSSLLNTVCGHRSGNC